MRITKKKALGVAAMAAVVATGGTAAYAYFTGGTGSGTGTGTVGTASALTVTVTPSATPLLVPGGPSQPFSYTVNNPGAAQQSFATVTVAINSSGGDITQGGTPVAGCLSTWFTATVSQPALLTLAPGASTAATNGTLTMPADATDNQNACESHTPDFTVTAA